MWNSSWKATVNLVKRIPILYSLFNTFCGLNLSQDVYHYDNVQYFFVIWVFDFAFGIRWICLKNTILWWFFLVVICMRDFLLHPIATKPWIFTGGWFCRGTESIKEGLLGFQSVKCTCSIGVCMSWKTREKCAYVCVERFAIGSNAVSCICGYSKLGNLLVFNFIFVAESLLKLSLQFYHSSTRYKLWCTALPKKVELFANFTELVAMCNKCNSIRLCMYWETHQKNRVGNFLATVVANSSTPHWCWLGWSFELVQLWSLRACPELLWVWIKDIQSYIVHGQSPDIWAPRAYWLTDVHWRHIALQKAFSHPFKESWQR